MLTTVDKGFSLIELLMVLAILTLVLSLVPLLFPNVIESMETKDTARTLANELKLAQAKAIRRQEDIAVSLDIQNKRYWIEKKPRALTVADDADIEMTIAESERISETQGRIRFFPDGSSTGGQIRLQHNNNDIVVDVQWLTGKVRIFP